MKKILSLLRNHWLEDFTFNYYSRIALFLGTALFINYSISLENNIIDRHPNDHIRIVWYLVLYSFAYYGASLIMIYSKKRNDLLGSKQFWLLTFAGILLLAINSGFPYMTTLLRELEIDGKIYVWVFAIGNNTTGFVFISLPLLLLHFFMKSKTTLYGSAERFNATPYLQLLLIILPIIAIASFGKSFQNYYPTYKTDWVSETLHWPGWVPVSVYEFVYGLDFFNTEFLFRGFMVIGLTHVLGKDAIIPMMATYCFLHFGKPAGEAISSIFGGYILGVVAFYTRSIWGGVLVHVGIAWMMELAAYLQKAF